MFRINMVLGIILVAVAMFSCETNDVEIMAENEGNLDEIELIEQQEGINFVKQEISLQSEDARVKATIVLAASSQDKLNAYLENTALSLLALDELPTTEHAPEQTNEEKTEAEVGYSNSVIIYFKHAEKADGVMGYRLHCAPKANYQARTKPEDLTDNYTNQDVFIKNDDIGFRVTQPTFGLPPAPLDRLGVEFWYKQGFLSTRWKLESFGTISAGGTRSDSRGSARKIQVVIGRETVSALYDIDFF